MKNLFISDLHLDEDRPEITHIFLKFLEDHTKPNHTLYILGDFFEIWIGDDHVTPLNKIIIEALKKATQQGLPIYIMHGNRDFLLGKKFLRETGCQLLPDEYVISLAGIPTLLMHGDTLCTLDTQYLKFRKKSRNRFFQILFLWKSLTKRKAVAEKMRRASKEHTSTTATYIMDVTQAEVERVMQKHHVQHLIHGHTHREAVHQFQLNNQDATRTVLAPWHNHGSVLICDEDGRQEIVVF